MSTPWSEAEPGLGDFFWEVGRLFRRARSRWLFTVSLTVIVTCGMVIREVRKQRKYPAKIVMSVEEQNVDDDVVPYTASAFQDYVSNAVFTDARLLELIERHDLHTMVKKQPELALESVREDIEVEAYRNLFLEYQAGKGDDRSARLAISFWATDPELALTVARELSELVITHEAEQRQAQVEVAKTMNQGALEQARADVSTLEREIAEVEQAIAAGGPGRLRFKLLNLKSSLKSATLSLQESDRERADLELLGEHERAGSGLKFEIADYGRAADPLPPAERGAILGVILFFVLLPLTAMAVGAFDPRVYAPEDVTRLGYRALGRVRAGKMPTA
jgi:uncharacterized protein involved in exopolysaccharide biosynthesis